MLYKTRRSARDFPLGLFILERSKDLPATNQKCIRRVYSFQKILNVTLPILIRKIWSRWVEPYLQGKVVSLSGATHFTTLLSSLVELWKGRNFKLAANFAVYSHSLEHSTFIHGFLKENRRKTTIDCTLIAPQKNNTKANGKEWFIRLRGKKIQWFY